MTGSAISRPRGGGIRKQRQKRDRDGDLVMGAAPRVATAARGSGSKPRTRESHTAPFTELKVTGWTDDKEVAKILNFLERHAARRSQKTTKGSVPPKMVKRHSAAGTLLKIFVRPDDVPAFGKINGFTFNSAHGTQKLTITGPGIRSKSPNAMDTTSGDKDKSTDKPETSETIEMLKGFLFRRYQAEEKLLNLSKIADDEEVAKSGMFNDARTQQKFFPALMVICDQTLKSEDQKREMIHSVTLAGNNLPNLDVVRNLSTTLPHILNLDLSGNKFASVRVLKPWKNRFRSLEHLIVEITEPGWEEELISWFPKLRILNGQQVRPDPVPAAPAAAGPAVPAAPATDLVPTPTVPAVPVSGLTPEQEQMVVYVMEQTNLKREMALQCLEAGKWDINAAGQLFLATKDTLGPDSFNS
ncbi:nuclear mRNA export, poly(A)+RNA binding protein [Didymosphaeria variabile]|uniref:Nuclear mRNA export, poly(A)+RNA binding protein n=1 Tax=Didymosphaeria variabile TaxID=1932322 RepID=A0A9W8XAL1_9PLEO|nr:nuclear mRNA export, poly(A)+RNA binding protein [Didymosphaeria variabile]KAJ4345772.1 nuclear mRNA export, poly(A)+RNA binding protein [Didymosphaeria variabile]